MVFPFLVACTRSAHSEGVHVWAAGAYLCGLVAMPHGNGPVRVFESQNDAGSRAHRCVRWWWRRRRRWGRRRIVSPLLRGIAVPSPPASAAPPAPPPHLHERPRPVTVHCAARRRWQL
jgi:hypothetical protein